MGDEPGILRSWTRSRDAELRVLEMANVMLGGANGGEVEYM